MAFRKFTSFLFILSIFLTIKADPQWPNYYDGFPGFGSQTLGSFNQLHKAEDVIGSSLSMGDQSQSQTGRRAMSYPGYNYPGYGYGGSGYGGSGYGGSSGNTLANMGQSQKVGNVYGGIVGMGAQFQEQQGSGRRTLSYDPYAAGYGGYPYYGGYPGLDYGTLAGMNQGQSAGQIYGSKVAMGSQSQGQYGG